VRRRIRETFTERNDGTIFHNLNTEAKTRQTSLAERLVQETKPGRDSAAASSISFEAQRRNRIVTVADDWLSESSGRRCDHDRGVVSAAGKHLPTSSVEAPWLPMLPQRIDPVVGEGG